MEELYEIDTANWHFQLRAFHAFDAVSRAFAMIPKEDRAWLADEIIIRVRRVKCESR